jgi:hypothetical protein
LAMLLSSPCLRSSWKADSSFAVFVAVIEVRVVAGSSRTALSTELAISVIRTTAVLYTANRAIRRIRKFRNPTLAEVRFQSKLKSSAYAGPIYWPAKGAGSVEI